MFRLIPADWTMSGVRRAASETFRRSSGTVPMMTLMLMMVSFSAAADAPSEPDAGSAGDRQTYRPGLRNSFEGYALSAQELSVVTESLRQKTGFVQLRVDESGFLTIADRTQIAGGSATARELLLAALDGRKSINLQSHNRSAKVVFARLGAGVRYIRWKTDEQIEVVPVEMDFDDFRHLRGDARALAAFDPGFVLLHELCHAVLELHDPLPDERTAGGCEAWINRARRELGLPERQQYLATATWRMPTISGVTTRIAELLFEQQEPGTQPDSRRKTKRHYLTWEVQKVGSGDNWSASAKGKVSVTVTTAP